jgi:hypothetical protein
MSQIPAREVGRRLNLEHKEVIRRIRKGDINAQKLPGGWFWLIEESEVERVKTEAPWYRRYKARHESHV